MTKQFCVIQEKGFHVRSILYAYMAMVKNAAEIVRNIKNNLEKAGLIFKPLSELNKFN